MDTSILKASQNQTNYFDKSPEEAEEFSPSAFRPVLEGLIAAEKNIDYNVKIHRTYRNRHYKVLTLHITQHRKFNDVFLRSCMGVRRPVQFSYKCIAGVYLYFTVVSMVFHIYLLIQGFNTRVVKDATDM